MHDEQRALIAMDADACFVPPYVGPSGWVGAVLSKADGDEVRELDHRGLAHDGARSAWSRPSTSEEA